MPTTAAGDIALALIAAIWARESARSAFFAQLNDTRDFILLRKKHGEVLTPDHCKLMYEADWKPMAMGTVAVAFLFAAVITFLPFLVTPWNRGLALLCWGVAVYQVGGSVLTAWTFIKDAKGIRKSLGSQVSQPES